MTRDHSSDVIARVVAAITGQSTETITQAFARAMEVDRANGAATDDEMRHLVDMVGTRLGLAPAVSDDEAIAHRAALAGTIGRTAMTSSAVNAWSHVLRHTPEHVPEVDRDPVVVPLLPPAQMEMWKTLVLLEQTHQPWVLVGGQMTILHCWENGVAPPRTTDDGDVVVGVWTRRDAFAQTSRLLRNRDFVEVTTPSGYGYRYRRGETIIDVLLPEGLERQTTYPLTSSGHPGLSVGGGNQALARAERLPVTVEGSSGHIRRPTLLGSIIVKAHAYVVDSRDPGRHAQDLVTLATIALINPRGVLQPARTNDRKPVRAALRRMTMDHPAWRTSDDAAGAAALLSRLAGAG